MTTGNMKKLILVFSIIFLLTGCSNQLGGAYTAYPNHKLTPGEASDAVTQNNIKKTICVKGYTKTVRYVPDSIKKEVYEEYGIAHHDPGQYEVDHLIALTDGGSNDISNLWPQPAPDYKYKDKLEVWVNKQICSGQMTLREGQKCLIKFNKCYKKILGAVSTLPDENGEGAVE